MSANAGGAVEEHDPMCFVIMAEREKRRRFVWRAGEGGGTVKEKGKEILSDLSRDPDPEEGEEGGGGLEQNQKYQPRIIPNPE